MNTRYLGLISGSQNVAEVAEGVELDGATDYLSRSSDLVGNVDSKTFTFSCWLYKSEANQTILYRSGKADSSYWFSIYASTAVGSDTGVFARNAAGTLCLNFTVPFGTIPQNTWVNMLVSIDMSSTSSRSVYINDKLVTATWSTYTVNELIDFTNIYQGVHGIDYSGGSLAKTGKDRLSHIFLDYTYRDLSIEANRRLFITADGKPADWNTTKALNGILMLQMKDAATAHINDGYGGNMIQNGTLDTASRGANQDNCVASYFDGVDDYLSRSSLTGIADGKQFTFSMTFKKGTDNSSDMPFFINTAGSANFIVYTLNGTVILQGYLTPNNSMTLNAKLPNNIIPETSRFTSFTVSIDMSDQSKCKWFLDGNDVSNLVAYTTFINQNIDFTGPTYDICKNNYWQGSLGELYFDTKYIDLATNNPFWDKDTNKPVPVRKVIANTGVTPLIAMPLDASNAGKNYGTGGDFTANSGPFVGARGASEYWQRTAKYDGSTSYFSRAGLLSITDANKLTFVANVYKTASVLYHLVGTTNSSVSISINASNQLVITAKNAAGTTILSATVTTTIANTTWTKILVSIDLSNTANRSVYLNGVAASATWTTYTNDSIDYTVASIIVGADIALANKFNGSMSLWFDNTYTDFTSEVNRNKYIDQLGYPKDLNSQVSSGIIAKPALFLNSDNVSALGANSGYGGDMTANGTIVSGSDVLG